MDNELGIIGYSKEETLKYKTANVIFCTLILYITLICIMVTIFSMLKINVPLLITLFVISFILYFTFTLIAIRNNKNNKEYFINIYFKYQSSKFAFLYSNNGYYECVKYILKNNIKPIKNDNYYLSKCKMYNNKLMTLYNTLKDQYEIINF